MTKGSKSVSQIENIYNQLAPVYNFVYGKLFFNEGRRVAIELLELEPKQKVLEVGVGTGLTLPMYPLDCKITGIDLSQAMLREARDLIRKQRINHAEVKYMNANQLDFPDNHFDAVLGNLFISATSDPDGAMREMKRVCKPGGVLVLMNHFRSSSRVLAQMENAFSPLAHRLGFDSALDLDVLLDRAGLKAKRLKKVNIFNLWTAVSMVNSK
jgi:phosphatidylethanolamine/phosphatidyl-N-methylethanolamine N-methyltransferase